MAEPIITSKTPTAGARFAADVAALLRARNPLIWIVTREEARAERFLFDACASAGYEPRTWDCATGIADAAGNDCRTPVGNGRQVTDAGAALAALRQTTTRQVLIMRDLPDTWLSMAEVKRNLRSLVRSLPATPRDQARAVIIVTPQSEIPPEIQGHAIVVDMPIPDRAEIGGILDSVVSALPDDIRAAALPEGARESAIDSAVGLSETEAQSTFARSLVQSRRIDPATVAAEKKRVITREKVLEWFDPLPGGLDSVGGLDNLKGWLMGRKAAFSERARAFGLPAPKGVLLVGVPGCGKSETAKAIATAYGMPLLRLDLGALKSKWVGDSEANIRRALKVAETVAPAVIWLDEIEKALGGATQGAADGGVSSDALGMLLSWLQDRKGSVFAVATANDVGSLPPELLRKGRWDEIFSIDLPTPSERASIVAVALKRHGRTHDGLDMDAIVASTVDFTGAEISALIPDALFAAFGDSERAIETSDITRAARETVPLAKTAPEKIQKIREWCAGRARPASRPDSDAPTSPTLKTTLDF
jgi:hypothetical protein